MSEERTEYRITVIFGHSILFRSEPYGTREMAYNAYYNWEETEDSDGCYVYLETASSCVELIGLPDYNDKLTLVKPFPKRPKPHVVSERFTLKLPK